MRTGLNKSDSKATFPTGQVHARDQSHQFGHGTDCIWPVHGIGRAQAVQEIEVIEVVTFVKA